MFLAAAENPLNASDLIFPVLECIHIAGFTILLGTIGLVDLRILGLGLRTQKPAEIARDVGPWTLIGLVLVLISGPLLFSSDPDMYYLNPSFLVKMVLLALAIPFHYLVRRKVALANGSGVGSKIVACTSLALWVGVIFGGIFIGFVNQLR